MSTAVAEPAAKRAGRELSFAWSPSGAPAFKWSLVVTETGPRSERSVSYRVDECESGPGYRSFLVAKAEDYQGARGDEIYTATVASDGTATCSCPGSSCRRHSIRCRHVKALLAGIESGAV